MRVARWTVEGRVEEGFVRDDAVIPFADGGTVASLLDGGLPAALDLDAGTGDAGARPLASVRLLAPLRPPTFRDFVAFEEHVEGVVRSIDGDPGVVPEWYEFPTFYFSNPNSIIATGDTVVPPEATRRLDFELELGAVIGGVPGQLALSLARDDAPRHIFGYTIINDWSARDVQAREMKVRLGPAKGKDFATTMGPWIVTADEFESRHDGEGFLSVPMEVEVNGQLIGRDLASNMGWPFRDLVAYASRDAELVAGDVLGSGTAGAGCLAELWGRAGALTPPPLSLGDVVVMRIEGIGEIRNTVGSPRHTPEIPRARARPRARERR